MWCIPLKFTFNSPEALVHLLTDGGFDLLVIPRVLDKRSCIQFSTKYAKAPLVQDDVSRWLLQYGSSVIIGQISSWIDLGLEDGTLRMDSEATLKQEIHLTPYLSLKATKLLKEPLTTDKSL